MNKKLPARALFYAIITSIFVALISSALLLSSYHQHLLLGYYQTQNRLVNNCVSATELILGSEQAAIPEILIDLFGKQKDSVSIEQKSWGVLDIVTISAWSGQGSQRDSIQKSFFIGKQAPNYALRLAEGTNPLYVCGNTKIVGDAFLPREGVERGFMQGKPYQRQKLIFGKQTLIKPIDNKALKARFEQLNNLKNTPSNVLLEGDSLINSFGKNTLVITSKSFNSQQLFLKGNILVLASQEIIVNANTELEDVVLVAPKILIQEGFQGNIQAFAWDSLEVEANVNLTYPSILSLLPEDKKRKFSPELSMQSGSKIAGAIVVPSFRYYSYKTKVNLQSNTIVNGQVWVDGLLQPKGVIYGAVACNKFLLQTPAAIYENYLLDAIIDRTLLPKDYLSPILISKEGNKRILKYTE